MVFVSREEYLLSYVIVQRVCSAWMPETSTCRVRQVSLDATKHKQKYKKTFIYIYK